MLNIKKINALMSFVLALSLIVAFSAIDSFAQKSGKGRYRKVALNKGAKKNGYTVTQQGRKEYYFQINSAEDPLTKKRLEGEKEVEFKCKEPVLSDLPIIHKLLFNNGNTDRRKIECLNLITPQIIIRD